MAMIPNAPIPLASTSSQPAITPDTESNLRTTKRKLDVAFESLDNAFNSPETNRPSPPKRPHTIRSLYSTLAKYGIKSKESRSTPKTPGPVASTSTPHLTAILTRAATRTRKAFPFKFSSSSTKPAPLLPPTADYRPSSLPAFLLRLATFKLATYANKPPAIDAVAAAKCGWINDGKDSLVCGFCQSSWVVAGRDGMNRDGANALLEKQRTSLVDMHKNGCPWRTRQCDPAIYRIPLQSPSTMVKDIKINALALDPILRNVEIKHPLTSTQISSMQSTISSCALESQAAPPSSASQHEDSDIFMTDTATEPSNTAILTSLFGWSIVPSSSPNIPTRRVSLSRATSLAPSTPRTPSLSRASSMHPMTPAKSSPRNAFETPTRPPSSQFTFRVPNATSKRDTSLLQCTLCQRRVGLWAFVPQHIATTTEPPTPSHNDVDPTTPRPSVPETPSKKVVPQRQFDLLKEHRSYCPYVVRSTIVPSLPVPPTAGNSHDRSGSTTSLVSGPKGTGNNGNNGAMEGWRAVLTVVLRYGAGQRQRLGLDFVDRLRGESRTVEEDEPMEVDGVKAMVAGVKSRGGKDLLRYVKGLLG
ncbi:hypothetical protein H0H81_003701 [Sphagnurus paluster]|uniref:Zf-C3HC-domain-containing protein n=1 Tax=Sphagnurus paluster TaxID=117069 RepID=A0A9P7GME4_9AGAR|nr:hypothetical protein H0H81_003701 [Sphagnurus paluster]